MSNSQPSTSNKPFLAVASLVIVLSASLLASAWPAVSRFSADESARLSRAGEQATGNEARLDYRLAYWLDRTNQAAATDVAAVQLTQGDVRGALAALKTAGQGTAASRMRIKTALEAGQASVAASAADRLMQYGHDDQDVVLAAMAYGVAGQPERIGRLKTLVASPGALQAVLEAESGNVALAQQLRSTGLVESSSGILAKSKVSVPRNMMLAELIQARGRKADLAQLQALYEQAVSIDPTFIDARTKLIAVLRAQVLTADADTQQKLLDDITNGRP